MVLSTRPCTPILSRSIFFLVALLAWLASAAPARGQSTGWLGPSYAGVETVPTASTLQSKLWWNDGLWWGCLWSADAQAYTIHALRGAPHALQTYPPRPERIGSLTWQDTLVAVDSRPKSRADCLWDGAKLYIATHQYTSGAGEPGHPLELFRYSYDPRLRSYSLDVGFPALIGDAKTSALVIDKDTQGRLWAVWMAGLRVWTAHTIDDDRHWSTPTIHPANTSDLDPDDVASVVAFQGHVGVMWSDRVLGRFAFATHTDGAPRTEWLAAETVLAGSGIARDEFSLRALPDGRVFAAIGTHDGEVRLAVRSTAGTWSDHLVAADSEDWSRPILLIDEGANKVHVFGTAPQSYGAIYAKSAPLDALSFASGVGMPVIRDASAPVVHDVTSTKQTVRPETGLLVLASHAGFARYVYQFDLLGGRQTRPPTARFFADPHGDYAPLAVQFHNASLGLPTSCFWDFGDGTTSMQRKPLHTYQLPGSYTVSLQVSNALGTDVETIRDLIQVSEVPTSLVLRAIGDAHAQEGAPDENRGWLDRLRIRGGRDTDFRTFMKFYVPPLPAQILGAELRLAVITGSLDGGRLYRVNNNWQESTLTWNTMPPMNLNMEITRFGEVDPGTTATLDLGPAVSRSGTLSFGLRSNDYHSAQYSSREGIAAPELRLELQPLAFSVARAGTEADRKAGAAPLMVQFFDASNGRVAAWHWDFGDGTTSALQNPSHVYRYPGRYTATLTVIGADGSAAASEPLAVHVKPRVLPVR